MTMIDSQARVVVLTGAGISAESGIRTFRDSNGLWEHHKIEDIATPEAFKRNPQLVWQFYKARWKQAQEVNPNPAHYALAKLESKLGNRFHLITQNVDGLHSRAGSKSTLEMHGNLSRCFCTKCKTKYNLADIDTDLPVPLCLKCSSMLRPDIVWFGEIPYYLYEIEQHLKKCNLFIIVGTSGVVYPAAGFVMTAKLMGAHTIAINLDKPDNLPFVNEFREGKSGEILPKLVDEWLGVA